MAKKYSKTVLKMLPLLKCGNTSVISENCEHLRLFLILIDYLNRIIYIRTQNGKSVLTKHDYERS